MNKIVIPVSYMASGSSAVTDLLNEVSSYKVLNKNFEYIFLHTPHGLFDLEDKLLLGNNALRSDEALHSFYATMKLLYNNKRLWFAGYKKKVSPRFLELCRDFIEDLITLKSSDIFWHHQEIPTPFTPFQRFFYKILHILSCRQVKVKKFMRYEEMWLSYPTREEFYQKAKKFLSAFFQEMGLQHHNIVLDQLLLPHNLWRFPNYFDDNVKVLLVERDVRDMFILNKYFFRLANAPVPYVYDAEVFVKEYLHIRSSERAFQHANILRLHFEDLVYHYEETVAKVFAFLDIDKKLHSKKKTRFIPEKSSKNTQLFRQNPLFKEEAELIAQKLPEYLYDFPFYENSIVLTEKDLIL